MDNGTQLQLVFREHDYRNDEGSFRNRRDLGARSVLMLVGGVSFVKLRLAEEFMVA